MIEAGIATWERFWFAPQKVSTLALIRIVFGLLTLCWAVSLSGDLFTFFGPHGLIVAQPPGQGWGVLHWFPNTTAVIALYVLLIVAAVCTTLGFGTRLATVALFVCIISFERRNPYIFNSGDAVLRNTSFFLMLAPAGAALSVDRLIRHRDRFWETPSRACWPLRLMQIQLCVIYLAAVWAKVRGTTWNDGTAVSYAMRIDDLARFPIPHFLATSPLLVSLMTYGTLATEFAIPILVWNRRLRPYVLAAGIAMHSFIDYRIMVGFFSYAIWVMYMSFIPPERAEVLISWARRELGPRLRARWRLRLSLPLAPSVDGRHTQRSSGIARPPRSSDLERHHSIE